MTGRTQINPALDPSEFRARQRRVLESMTPAVVFALLGWLLPGIYVLVGVGFMAFRGEVPPTPGLALVPWLSVLLYGLLVARAAIVPLRQRPGKVDLVDDDGRFVAERGGHAMVWAAGAVYTLLWTGVVVLFVGFEGAWAVVGWSAIGALALLTLASALRDMGGMLGLVPAEWQTHPDDALAAAAENADEDGLAARR